MRFAFPLLACALALAGCGVNDLPAAGSEGDECTRTFECGPGLACVMGACSGDLSGIEGALPADGGVPYDGGMVVDSGSPPVDSGPPPVDSGSPPVDSGVP